MEVPRGSTPRKLCSYGYQHYLVRAFATKALPFMIKYKKGQRGSTLCYCYIAMTTCFMSNQTCRLGGGFLFYFISVTSLPEVTTQSLLVNTTPLCGYGAPRVWNWLAFIIWLIPGSLPCACRLERMVTRLGPQ